MMQPSMVTWWLLSSSSLKGGIHISYKITSMLKQDYQIVNIRVRKRVGSYASTWDNHWPQSLVQLVVFLYFLWMIKNTMLVSYEAKYKFFLILRTYIYVPFFLLCTPIGVPFLHKCTRTLLIVPNSSSEFLLFLRRDLWSQFLMLPKVKLCSFNYESFVLKTCWPLWSTKLFNAPLSIVMLAPPCHHYVVHAMWLLYYVSISTTLANLMYNLFVVDYCCLCHIFVLPYSTAGGTCHTLFFRRT